MTASDLIEALVEEHRAGIHPEDGREAFNRMVDIAQASPSYGFKPGTKRPIPDCRSRKRRATVFICFKSRWPSLPDTKPLHPKDHLAELTPLLPSRHSPVRSDGRGNPNTYLASIPETLVDRLRTLLQGQLESTVELIRQNIGRRP